MKIERYRKSDKSLSMLPCPDGNWIEYIEIEYLKNELAQSQRREEKALKELRSDKARFIRETAAQIMINGHSATSILAVRAARELWKESFNE